MFTIPFVTHIRRRFLVGAAAAAAVPLFALPAGCAGPDAAAEDVEWDLPRMYALTASQAVAAIASGDLSAVTYVTALLDRAEALQDLHAVITLDRDGATATAAAVDEDVRRGRALGALAGLPLLVKDNIDVAGLPTTGGTPALRDHRPARDADFLTTVLAAGAVVMGKANMHELALGVTTTNSTPFAGFAKNPYDLTRVPGGSSGGTAAAIAARITPAGFGTDTGASVRVPAAFTGIVGLRPSTGNGGQERSYSTAGVLPLSHTLDTPGPFARTVADVALLDAVVTGTPAPAPAPLARVRLAVPAVLWADLEEAVREVATAARDRLAAAGAVIVDVDIPDLLTLSDKIIFPLALHEPIADIPAYLEDSGATQESGVTLAGLAEQIASPDVKTSFGAVLTDALGPAYPDAIDVHRPALQALLADYFATHEVEALLFPTSPVLPALIDTVNGSGTISVDGGPQVPTFNTTIRNTVPGSSAGLPGLSLPAGQTTEGLPVGISLEGPVGTDTRILSIGMAVEEVLGVLPPPAI